MKKFLLIFVSLCLPWPIILENNKVYRNETSSDYFIATSNCHMRRWPFYKKKPNLQVNCQLSEHVVTYEFNEQTERYYLKYLKPEYKCRYCPVFRKKYYEGVEPIKCLNLPNNFEVPQSMDNILVKCSKKRNTVYDAIPLIQKKDFARTKLLPPQKMPSILMLGIDSLSKVNLRRMMPNSFKYLNEEGNFIELLGYNKAEDNTFPNLMAILTGQDYGTLKRKCNRVNLTDCNFIWDDFKSIGYITAYGEDAQDYSTFSYGNRAFGKQPVDFYFKPMGIAMEKNMKYITQGRREKVCIGHKFYADYIYEYGLEFHRRYNNTPTFGLFWTNTFSHGSSETATGYDKGFRKKLIQFQKEGVFEKSIVFVLSDHGFRFGPILNAKGGFYEPRLPFVFIRLPEWFKNQYPHFAQATKTNRNRLTSNYDLYETFKHIIQLYEPTKKLPNTTGCKTCQSVFREIPENRTCSKAGIPNGSCTCDEFSESQFTEKLINIVVNTTIKAMNEYLFDSQKLDSTCQKIKFFKVITAEEKYHENKDKYYTFKIKYMVNPFRAIFRAIVDFYPKTKLLEGNVEQIERIDSYEKTANCIENKDLKKYCLCKQTIA